MQARGFNRVRLVRRTCVDWRRLGRFGVSLMLVVVLLAAFPAGGVQGQLEQTQAPPPNQEAMLAAAASTKLGINYMGMLAVDDGARRKDYLWLSNNGYKLIRIWATWSGPVSYGSPIKTTYGSLVDATGAIRTNEGGLLRSRFIELLRQAEGKTWVIDISFDVDEFKAIGGTKYEAFKTAITMVRDLVLEAEAQYGADYHDNVIFDVVNEGINAKKVLGDGNNFLSLWKLGGAPSGWVQAITDLLDVPKLNGFRSFFSMKGVGNRTSDDAADRSGVRDAAKYYYNVYKSYAGLPASSRPLLAPTS